MADPFVAEIRIFPFNFAPKGWAWCDGQLLPLSQNTALFSLLGTTYGGNGKSNFALPDLQGTRADAPGPGPGPVAARPRRNRRLSETVTLLESEIPAHTHALSASPSADGQLANAAGQCCATGVGGIGYSTPAPGRCPARCRRTPLAPAGGDQPHNNMQPYLTFYFNIALQGVFPPRGK